MVRLINKLATKKHSQGALSPHEPAPTVMALPDDFVHPTLAANSHGARVGTFPVLSRRLRIPIKGDNRIV